MAISNAPIVSPTGDPVKLIAFYLTQFHPIPENDLWWGRGFTEWTNVTKARPWFRGHYQPHLPADLGFYDLRVAETRHDQIALAKQFGIDGFCYYYYWFSGKRLLERPLEDMLVDEHSDMPFCLCWANENWTRRWDAADQEILIAQNYGPDDDVNFINSLIPYFKDPRYIRFDGAPLLIVYRPQALPDARRSAQSWRAYCEKVGIGRLQIFCALTHHNWDYRQFGFDGGVEFPPHNMTQQTLRDQLDCEPDYDGYVFDASQVAQMYLARDYSNENVFRSVFPSWDNSSRRGRIGAVGLNGTPENYEYWLSQAIERTRREYPNQERLIFINAWNEWAEGCHLEPDRKYGRKFLAATAKAKAGQSHFRHWTHCGIPLELARLPIPTQPVRVPSSLQRMLDKVSARLQLGGGGRIDELNAQVHQLTSQRDLSVSQRDELMLQRDELLIQRDSIGAQRSELIEQRDLLSQQRRELIAQRDELIAQRDELVTQRQDMMQRCQALTAEKKVDTVDLADFENVTAQRDDLIAQIASLAGAEAARDRLARQLASLAQGSGKERLLFLTSQLEQLRSLYLDVMEKILIGTLLEDPPLERFGQSEFDAAIRNRGLDWPKQAFSMIGAARMRNFRTLLEQVIANQIPGDIVETGVWRGGASILARAVLAAYGIKDRRVILADSFEGLPPPDKEHYPADEGSVLHQYQELAVSEEDVRRNFEKFNLYDDQVVLLKGWFKDTMPLAPADRIAILRLDGDLYESTIIPLTYLFDKVTINGWVIVDDYECIPACKMAVHDFLADRNLAPKIKHIDGVGVFFQKTDSQGW